MGRNARRWFSAAALVCLAFARVPGPAAQERKYAGTEWAAPGGDRAHTRYSPLTQISTKNVQQLGGAWVVELAADEASKAPAMVANDRLFVTANSGIVIALDPSTGTRLWTYRPDAARRFSGVRGIGLGEGLLFAGLRDSNVLALRQDTGAVAWVSEHGPEIPSQGMSAAPAYGNGVVVAVVSLGDNFLRGRAIALDAKTGKILWTFDVIPRPGEPGHETWPQGSDIWQYGGGAIWTTPSVDEELGLVYLETGNAVPQWGGELRPGDNLYNNSVVALDLKTGKKRWHFQTVHHDLWEHDLSTPLVLYDTAIGGRTRKVLMAMRTDGAPFFLDRATGEPVVPVDERPVKQDAFLKTSATQPFTRGAGRVGPSCVDARMIPAGFVAGCYFDPIRADMPNVLMPHMNMRQSPMAYSPRTGYLYATACVNPIWIRREESGWAFVRPVKPPGMKQSGLMTALDARTGAVIWDKPLAYAACEGGSGATATAGDLVFHAEPDGEFQAYDARSGAVVWRFQTGQVGMPGGAGPGGGSPIVYQNAKGQQYVALTMNRTVWAFTLGGTVPPRMAPPPPPTSIEWTDAVRTGVSEIELGVVRTYNIASANKRVTWADDYALSTPRVRLVAGVSVTWKNTSTLAHTLVARDASWATPTIQPGASGSATIARPGTYEYICREHPWTMGQLIVD